MHSCLDCFGLVYVRFILTLGICYKCISSSTHYMKIIYHLIGNICQFHSDIGQYMSYITIPYEKYVQKKTHIGEDEKRVP